MEDHMSNLVVIGFKNDAFRASQVLNTLVALDDRWVVDLKDAVAVYRDNRGELRLDQSFQMTTGEGAGLGLFWGSVIGALLAIPFTAGASAAAAGGALAAGTFTGGTIGAVGGAIDADWWKDEFGISEAFVHDVGRMIGTGDSAIFMLLRSAEPEYVTQQLAPYGGKVLWATLTREQKAKLQAILDSRGFKRVA
jgi:uncharacterized membrane protein